MEITENEILQRRSEIVRKRKQLKSQRDYERRLKEQHYCEVCKVEFDKYYLEMHLKSKKHQRLKEGKGTELKLCECCARYVAVSYWKKHIESTMHKENSTL